MKVEVGEYIRTKQGTIGKAIEKYCVISNTRGEIDVPYENIVKHSKNIIDLIEVGDYVNGKKVLQKIGKFLEVSSCDIGNNRIYDYMIKSIVTKQQFSNMEYRL